MKIKGIIDEDFVNYKKPSMVVMFPNCTFKCDKECGQQVCQNGALATAKNINIGTHSLIYRYIHNKISKAIVLAGLEPMDDFNDVLEFITSLRTEYQCDDDVVIYTGYNESEIQDQIFALKHYNNIIVKFGRFIPNQPKHRDNILGIDLASSNQYAKVIS